MSNRRLRNGIFGENREDGWCWWYRKYAPGNTKLEHLENAAREAKKGLWVDPQPVPPWERWKGLLPKGTS